MAWIGRLHLWSLVISETGLERRLQVFVESPSLYSLTGHRLALRFRPLLCLCLSPAIPLLAGPPGNQRREVVKQSPDCAEARGGSGPVPFQLDTPMGMLHLAVISIKLVTHCSAALGYPPLFCEVMR